MNEFDLRKFLYNNPLMEKKEDSKKGNKEEQKRMKGAIEDDADHIEKLKKDLKADKKKLSKLKKDEPKDVNEEMSDPDMRDDIKGTPEFETEDDIDPKNNRRMTKEGLKSMIREKITSILNEEDDDLDENNIDPGTEPKSFLKKKPDYQMFEQEDDEVDVDVKNKVDVKDKNVTDVDIEKDTEVDDVSKETDIDVKTSLPGESEDVDAVLGLLTKASEEADRFGDDPELKTQIGNTITYFTRKHVAKS